MICKFSHLTVGQITILNVVDGNSVMCDECGGPAGMNGSNGAVYEGHRYLTRYGTCDVFRYTIPLVCTSCGKASTHWFSPCGDGDAAFFKEIAHVKEKQTL